MALITLDYVKQKWIHEGFQKYFRNIGWAFAGRLFSLTMSFLVGALVARYLGPERYGTLNYALSFVILFVFISSFGVDNTLVREVLKYKERTEIILNTAFVIKVLGAFLVVLLATSFSIFVHNDFYTTVLIFIYSFHLFFISLNVTDSYFQSLVKYKYLFVAQFISTLAVSVLKLFLIFMGLGTGWFILALVFETAISSFVLLKIFSRYGQHLSFKLDKEVARTMLHDAWPFILSSAFYLVYTKIDQVMIGKMMNTTSLGVYAAGVKLAEFWYFIPAIISGVVFPAIVSAKLANVQFYRNRIKKMFIFLITLSVFIAGLQVIFAKEIILLLFGPAYVGAVSVLKIYTWAGVIVSVIILLQQYLIVENKTKIIMYASLFGALANIGLNLVFIPKFGIVGSAWATLASYSIIPISIYFLAKKSG
jgi:O-antigen/teichoic acid export membrane protein